MSRSWIWAAVMLFEKIIESLSKFHREEIRTCRRVSGRCTDGPPMTKKEFERFVLALRACRATLNSERLVGSDRRRLGRLERGFKRRDWRRIANDNGVARVG